MGMDIFGKNGNYYRASIWQWRCVLVVMSIMEIDIPRGFDSNDGEGFDNQHDSDRLADIIDKFLTSWDEDTLIIHSDKLAICKDTGRFIDPGSENSVSPFQITREKLKAFSEFLRESGGFEIH